MGGYHVRGYDPRTGKELWRFKDEAEVKTPTPFASDGKVFATPAISRGTMCVRTRGHVYAISATGRAAADR